MNASIRAAWRHSVVALGYCVMIACGASVGFAGEPEYELGLFDGEVAIGESVKCPVYFENQGDEIVGLQFSLCHDGEKLDIKDAAFTDEFLDFDAFLTQITMDDDGFRVSVVMSLDGSSVLDNDLELEVTSALYAPATPVPPDDAADLEFCELGDPPVTNRVVTADGELEPVLVGATLTVLEAAGSFTGRIGDVEVPCDSETFTVPVYLQEIEDNPADLFPSSTEGYQLGVGHDRDYLTAIDAGVAGAVGDLNGGDGPDFLDVDLEPASGPGMTIGVLYDFDYEEFIDFEEEKQIAELTYESLVTCGDEDSEEDWPSTTVYLANGLGSPVIDCIVVVDGDSFNVEMIDGTISWVTPRSFLRGDVNGDGEVSALPDGLGLLNWGFTEAEDPPCRDAADANGDDTLSALPDALFLLRWGFTDGPAPPDPGTEECGTDPEPDNVACDIQPDICD